MQGNLPISNSLTPICEVPFAMKDNIHRFQGLKMGTSFGGLYSPCPLTCASHFAQTLKPARLACTCSPLPGLPLFGSSFQYGWGKVPCRLKDTLSFLSVRPKSAGTLGLPQILQANVTGCFSLLLVHLSGFRMLGRSLLNEPPCS